MTSKHNWSELKVHYYLSPHFDVAEWGRQFFGSNEAVKSGNFYKRTKNWRKEKETYHKQLQAQTLAQVRNDRIANYIRLNDKLFSLIDKQLEQTTSVKDLYMLWQIITTAQGLPTRINSEPTIPAQSNQQGLVDLMRIAHEEAQRLGLDNLTHNY